MQRESRSAAAAALAAGGAAPAPVPLYAEDTDVETDDDAVEVVRGIVTPLIIEDIPALANFEDEEYTITRTADGSFSLAACVTGGFPTLAVVPSFEAHIGFRVDAVAGDGDAPTPAHVVVLPVHAMPTSPARAQKAASKQQRLIDLVAVCPTAPIAKRLLDLDYSPEMLKHVTIEVLLDEFDPPLSCNAGQRHALSLLCMQPAESMITASSARLARAASPPANGRRETCERVSRRASAATGDATEEMYARHHAGAFGAESDDDDAREVPAPPPREAAAPRAARGSAVMGLSATVNENRYLATLLRQVVPADLPRALRATLELVKPGATYDPELSPFLIEGMLQHLTVAAGRDEDDLGGLIAVACGVGPAIVQCQKLVAGAASAEAGGGGVRQQSRTASTSNTELTALGELIVSSGSKGDEKEKTSLERSRIKVLVQEGGASPYVRTVVETLHEAVRSPTTTKASLMAMVREAELGTDGQLVSELLHSSHLWSVTGMLSCPEDRKLVSDLRVVIEGIDRTLGGIVKRLLPTGADCVKVATAIRTGQLRSLKVGEVSFPLLKEGWLSAVTAGAKGKQRAAGAATPVPSLQRIWAALEYGLVVSHGRDTTMHFALTEAYMQTVLANSVSGVAELVLGRLMCEYEDAWTSCHRGTSGVPIMRDILDLPEMQEQMMCVSQARMQAEQGLASSAVEDDQLVAMKAELKELAHRLAVNAGTVTKLVAASPTVTQVSDHSKKAKAARAAAAAAPKATQGAAAAAAAAEARAAAAAKAQAEKSAAEAKTL
jgi:hypothetical protein